MSGYVYLIGSNRFGWFKIGKSRSPKTRVNTIGAFLPFVIEVFAVWKTDNHTLLETYMHGKYSNHRVNGEWFSFDNDKLHTVCEDSYPYNAKRIATRGGLFKSKLVSDVVVDNEAKLRKQKGLVFMEQVRAYLAGNNLPTTTSNLKLAKKTVHDMYIAPDGTHKQDLLN